MKFRREWAMPSADTFSIKPIGEFVKWNLNGKVETVGPFARNKRWCKYTNDLNPETQAEYHLDAEEFLNVLHGKGIIAEVVIFDPPYSPRQISECYKSIGKKCSTEETQMSLLHKKVRNAIDKILPIGGIVLSFGWNSVGMGITRGYEIQEIMLVCHGGGHNDTICIKEIKSATQTDIGEPLQPTTAPICSLRTLRGNVI